MMKHRILLRTRYRDTDAAGAQYFANLLNLAHDALEEFVEASGIGWKQWFQDKTWEAPIRHVESNYLRPIEPNKELEIEASVNKIGNSSIAISYHFFEGSEEMGNATITHVFIDGKSGSKISVPEVVKSCFKQE